jgi:hypothetical protein
MLVVTSGPVKYAMLPLPLAIPCRPHPPHQAVDENPLRQQRVVEDNVDAVCDCDADILEPVQPCLNINAFKKCAKR